MTGLPSSTPAVSEVPSSRDHQELAAFVQRVQQRVRLYLAARSDDEEQTDHLRHVADRTRWLYYSELQRANPGASVRVSEQEDALIQACAYTHDIGKWIPRDELGALIPEQAETRTGQFAELKLTANQSDLLMLAMRKRLALPQDGYTPEYDSAHHLVSAYMLVADRLLGFHRLSPGDQAHLITMIVGHQFGSYFKESLLNLSLRGVTEVTTGMLMDVSRPERLAGDTLGSCFHDADISDLLFIGSLERRPNREDIFHTGGLIKILLINLTLRINNVPNAPADLAACIRSCQGTVASASKEFLTQTAVEHGYQWRREARRFLGLLQERSVYERLNSVMLDASRPAADRLTMVRSLARLYAREFLNRPDEDE